MARSIAPITDLSLIRRDNILKIVADMGEGLTGKQVAKKLGISYPAYNGFKADPPRSNVGTKLVDQINNKLNLKEDWLDRDRRNGDGDAKGGQPSDNCMSMTANGFVVSNKRITNFQANEIMKILLED